MVLVGRLLRAARRVSSASVRALHATAARPAMRVRAFPRMPTWRVPALGFGSPDGAPTFDAGQRSDHFFSALVQQGARLVLFDGDSCARGDTPPLSASAAPAAPGGAARRVPWEGAALRRVLATGAVSRAELLVCAGFSSERPEALPERVAAAAAAVGCGHLDLLLLQVSGSDATLSDAELRALLAAAEGAVDAGLARAYGMHARDWHLLERAESGSSGGGGGASLPRLFRLLEERVQADGGGSASAPHRCVAISSPAALASPGPLLPAAQDASGDAWSVAQFAERYGMMLLLTAPLDCQLPAAPFAAAIARVEGASAAADAPPPPPPPPGASAVRPFRCVDAPLHRDRHPARLAALLNDIVNFAIHCELLWERRVRALVAEERAAAAPAAADAETAPPPPLPPLQDSDVAWAQLIVSRLEHPGFLTLMEWAHVKQHRLLPALARLGAACQGIDAAREWAQCYRGLMAELVDKVDAIVEQRHGHQAAVLGRALLDELAAGGAVAAAASSSSSSSGGGGSGGGDWGRVAAPPLHAIVAQILLAFPNTLLVSEVPELHQLGTRASTRVRVEELAGRVLGTAGGASGDGVGDADAGDALPAVTPRDAQRVLRAVVSRGLVLAAATSPLPDWADPLRDAPTQAELAPLQEAMRRMRSSLPAVAA